MKMSERFEQWYQEKLKTSPELANVPYLLILEAFFAGANAGVVSFSESLFAGKK